MSFTAILGVFVALGAVLALMLVALRVLKRFAPGGALGGRARLPMEVVQRLQLGPKHSIAVVRVGDRVLTVAVGEGGVQPLGELDGEDRTRVLASSQVPTPLASSDSATRGISALGAGALGGLAAHPELAGLPGGRWVAARLGRLGARGAAASAASTAPIAAVAAPARPVASAELVTGPIGGNAMPHAESPHAATPHAGADAFRAVLSVALSPATKLALLLLAGSALAAPAARAQAPAATQAAVTAPASAPAAAPAAAATTGAATTGAATTAAPTVTAPATPTATPVATPTATAPTVAAPAALPTLPAATRAALVQAALRQTAAQRAGAPATGLPTAPAGTPRPAGAAPIAPGASAPPAGPAGGVDTMIARLAPQLDLRVGNGKDGGLRLSGTVGVVVMMGLLTLLPTLVLMMTGFTRILVVLHFLKQAIGTQTAPPNQLVAALALILTGFVMAPTISEANRTALQPWLAGRMEQSEMMQVGVKPFREFMLSQTRDRDLQTFVDMSNQPVPPKTVDDVPLVVVMSAFVTSELRTAFQLGFALFLPFIVIDVVVSAVLMSMGMMMLPPAMVALPFKLLLFVLVDGWTLVIQSLVQSFHR